MSPLHGSNYFQPYQSAGNLLLYVVSIENTRYDHSLRIDAKTPSKRSRNIARQTESKSASAEVSYFYSTTMLFEA
jgi:hypothetical protein